MKSRIFIFFKKFGRETCSHYLVQEQCAISDIVRFSSEPTLFAKTVAFVEHFAHT